MASWVGESYDKGRLFGGRCRCVFMVGWLDDRMRGWNWRKCTVTG